MLKRHGVRELLYTSVPLIYPRSTLNDNISDDYNTMSKVSDLKLTPPAILLFHFWVQIGQLPPACTCLC